MSTKKEGQAKTNVNQKLMSTNSIKPTEPNYHPLTLKHLTQFQVTYSNDTSGQYNTMQCNDNPGQPKTNVNKKQISTKKNVNQKHST